MASQVTNRHHIRSILRCLINLLSGLICNDRGLQKVIDFIQSFFSDSMAVEMSRYKANVHLSGDIIEKRRFINELVVHDLLYRGIHIYQLVLPLFLFVVEAELRRLSMTITVIAVEKK